MKRFVCIFLFLIASFVSADIVYVDNDAGGVGTGESWLDAFADLQSALEIVQPGDEVWIASGTYNPGTDRSDSFMLKAGVSLYGGFSGVEASKDERDPGMNLTILSGEIGNSNKVTDNSFHVIIGAEGAVIDGLIVEGGNANKKGEDGKGAGLTSTSAALTISNCIFRNLNANENGGAVYLQEASSSIISDCTFLTNSAGKSGGGLYIKDSVVTVSSCVFNGNTSNKGGGATLESGSNSTFTDCVFENNITTSDGGAVYIQSSDPVFVNCTFNLNTAGEDGGAVYSHASSPEFKSSIFTDNTASSGGAVFIKAGGTALIAECIFSGNTAVEDGGALYTASTAPVITKSVFYGNSALAGGAINLKSSNADISQTTIYGNTASESGAGINTKGANPEVTSSIVWGNIGDEVSGSIDIVYSDVEGGYPGDGNIDADPLFLDPVNGDFTLQPDSPCIGAGEDGLDIGGVDFTPVNVKPIAILNTDATQGIEPLVVNFDGSSSYDPDGTITLYEWDFEFDGVTFVADQSGPALAQTSYIYTTAGTFTAALRVSDNNAPADTALAQVVITVTPADLPPSAPSGITSEAGDAQVTLDWVANPENDIAGYNIYRSEVPDGPYTKLNAAGLITALTYTDSGLINGVTYYYVITAVDNAAQESEYSGEVYATPQNLLPPGAPIALSAEPGDELISLDWDDNPEVDLAGYNVYRSEIAGGSYTKLNITLLTLSEYSDTSLSNGIEYFYVVTAVDTADNESGFSNEASAIPVDTTAPGSVSDLTASLSDNTVILTWNNPADVDFAGVKVVRSETAAPSDPDAGILVYQGTGENVTDTGLVNGTTYFYSVFSYDEVPNYSEAVSISSVPVDTIAPAVPAGLNSVPDDMSVSLDWNDSTDQDLAGYNLYRSTVSGGGYSKLNTGLLIVSSAQDAGLVNGTTYYYVVTAVDDDGLESAYSTETSVIPVDALTPAQVSGVTAQTGDNTVTLSWTNPTDDDFAGVMVRKAEGAAPVSVTEGVLLYNGTGTAVSDIGLINGTEYYYSFFTYDEVPNYSIAVSVSATPEDTVAPAVPTGLAALSGDMKANIDWSDNADADLAGYNIYKSLTAGGPYTKANTVLLTASEFEDTGLVNTTTYYYAVTAVDDDGLESAKSGEVSVIPADVTAPQSVTDLSAVSGDESVVLSWTNPADTDFAGVKIVRKAGSIPSDINDGTEVYSGDAVTFTDTGLTNGVIYFYSVYAYDEVPNYSIEMTEDAIPADVTAPGQISNFTAVSQDESIALSWDNPADTDLAGVKIVRKIDSAPADMNDGTEIFNGAGISFRDTGLTNGTRYFYAAFAFDEVPNFSVSVTTDAIPADVTAPGGVTGINTVAGDNTINLSWTNPADADFAGVMIRKAEGTAPASESEGTLVYNGTGTSLTDSGLVNGTALFYSFFTYDEVPNYSDVVSVSATPVDTVAPASPVNLSVVSGDMSASLDWDDNAENDLAGYNIYRKAALGDPFVKINTTLLTVTEYADTGLVNTTTYYYSVSAVDDDGLESVMSGEVSVIPADVTAPQPATGFTAVSGDESVALAWSNPDDSDFAGVLIIRKENSAPSGVSDGSEIYSGTDEAFTDTGLTNGISYFYAVFAYDEVQNYSAGQTSSAIPADVTAPSPISNFSAISQSTSVVLTWENPVDADLAGVKIIRKVNSAPADINDGIEVFNGVGVSYTDTGLVNGTLYFYMAFTYDEVENYSTGSSTSVKPSIPPIVNASIPIPNAQASGGQVLFAVKALDPDGTIISVEADLTSISGSVDQEFYDDGTNGDSVAGDDIYSYIHTIGTELGPKSIPVTVTDVNNTKTYSSLEVVVSELEIGYPDVRIDSSLPEDGSSQVPVIANGSNVYVAWRDFRNGDDDIYFNYATGYGETWLPADIKIDDAPAGVHSMNPELATCGDNVYIAWLDYRNVDYGVSYNNDIYFDYSHDGGTTWHTDIRINTGTPGAIYCESPKVACKDNFVYVTWDEGVDKSEGGNSGDRDIYFNCSMDYGQTWLPTAIRIDDAPANTQSYRPQLAIWEDMIYVVWEDARSAPGTYNYIDLYFTYSHDNGQTWSPNIKVNPIPTNYARGPKIACYDNYVYVQWQDKRNGNFDVYFNYSNDWGQTWQSSDNIINTNGPGTSASMVGDIRAYGNNVYIVFSDDRENGYYDVYFNYSMDNGITWASSDQKLNKGPVSVEHNGVPKIQSSNNNIYVVWNDKRYNEDFGHADIYLNYSTDGGATWQDNDIRINTDDPGNEVSQMQEIACFENYVYMVWSDWRVDPGGDIFFNKAVYMDTTVPDQPGVPTPAIEGDHIKISWPSNDEPDLLGYNVYRQIEESGFELISGEDPWPFNTYEDYNVVDNTTYSYYVTAVDTNLNESIPSLDADITVPDLTPPEKIAGFAADPNDSVLDLTWSNQLNDFAGVLILRNTVDITDEPLIGTEYMVGDSIGTSTVEYIGADENYTDSPLTNGQRYFYAIFAYDNSYNYSEPAFTDMVPVDYTPPGPVSGEDISVAPGEITLSWVNPSDGDLDGILVVRNTDNYPETPGDGDHVYYGKGELHLDQGLADETTYCYSLFSIDESGNVLFPPVTIQATTPDSTRPGEIVLRDYVEVDGEIYIEWTNPDDQDLDGVYIYRIAGVNAPAGQNPDNLVFTGTASSMDFTDNDGGAYLINGQPYSYRIYTFDDSGNTSQDGTVLENVRPNPNPRPTDFYGGIDADGIGLGWGLPTGSEGIIIRRRSDGVFPTSPSDGEFVVETFDSSPSGSYIDTQVTINTVYYYSAFASTWGEFSGGAHLKIAYTIEIPPAVENFRAGVYSPSGGVQLNWDPVNTPYFEKYIIVASADGIPPETPTGGDWAIEIMDMGTDNYFDFSNADAWWGAAYSIFVKSSLGIDNYSEGAPAIAEADPIPPTGVIATSSDGSVRLDWSVTQPSMHYYKFKIYRSPVQGAGYTLIGTNEEVGALLDEYYIDNEVANGYDYYYVVTMVYGDDTESIFSDEVYGHPADPNPPTVPSNLQAAAGDMQINLSWGASGGDLKTYCIYRKDSISNTYGKLDIGDDYTLVNYSDDTVNSGILYTYKITAVDDDENESDFSNEASAEPFDTIAPTVPQNLIATPGDGVIYLNWLESEKEYDWLGYRVLRSLSENGTYERISELTIPDSYFADDGPIRPAPVNGTPYYYKVASVDKSGNLSGFSDPVMATPRATMNDSWWDVNWLYRNSISVDCSFIDEDLTGFTVKVTLVQPAVIFDFMQPNGEDLRFIYDNNGVLEEIPYEIEKWDTSFGSEEAIVWVKIPQVSSIENTVIYLYYGNSTVSTPSYPESTWESDFTIVQHMNESTGNIYDSVANIEGTANGTNLSYGEEGVSAESITLGAETILNPDSYFSVNHTTGQDITTALTLSSWINLADATGGTVLSKTNIMDDPDGISGNYVPYELSVTETGITFNVISSTHVTGTGYETANHSISTENLVSKWVFVSGTYDGSYSRIYVNGALASEMAFSSTLLLGSNGTLILGGNKDSSDSFQNGYYGALDEVRLSKCARSAAWIKAEYFNTLDRLFSISSLENGNADQKPTAPLLLQAQRDGDSVRLNWLKPVNPADGSDLNYTIYRSIPLGEYSRCGETVNGLTEFIDDSSVAGTEYEYRVTASDIYGEGVASASVRILLEGRPSVPKAVSVSQQGTNLVKVAWEAPSTDGGSPISEYHVYRGNTRENLSIIASLTALEYESQSWYEDNTVSQGTTYYYAVSAENTSGEESDKSWVYPITIEWMGLPSVPQNLQISRSASASEVYLSWEEPADTGTLVEYHIYRAEGTGSLTYLASVGPDVFVYRDQDGIDLTKNYSYTISAENVVGEGPQITPALEALVSGIDTIPPEPIESLSASVFDKKIIVEWLQADNLYGDLEGYNLYYKDENTGFSAAIDVGDVLSFVIDNSVIADIKNGMEYTVQVKSRDTSGLESVPVEITCVPIKVIKQIEIVKEGDLDPVYNYYPFASWSTLLRTIVLDERPELLNDDSPPEPYQPDLYYMGLWIGSIATPGENNTIKVETNLIMESSPEELKLDIKGDGDSVRTATKEIDSGDLRNAYYYVNDFGDSGFPIKTLFVKQVTGDIDVFDIVNNSLYGRISKSLFGNDDVELVAIENGVVTIIGQSTIWLLDLKTDIISEIVNGSLDENAGIVSDYFDIYN